MDEAIDEGDEGEKRFRVSWRVNDAEVSRCCPKRHVSRAPRHGGEEGYERKGGIVRPHPSNLRRMGWRTGGGE